MAKRFAEESLLGHLETIVDPRRREGRIYPLTNTMEMLVLRALNGESSLRGMWQWGGEHWSKISRRLGFTGQKRPPSYETVVEVIGAVAQELKIVVGQC